MVAKILVVDDDPEARNVAVNVLTRAGHKVEGAEDGVQGLSKYQDERPNAVLLDINMPRMDGMSTLVAIRRYDPKARVIMVTGLADKQLALAAARMGASDFVVKPYKVDRLLLAVGRLLEGQAGDETPRQVVE